MKTPQRLARIEEIFHAALERQPAERAAFLAEACADDPSLLDAVNALLAAHDQSFSLLDQRRDGGEFDSTSAPTRHLPDAPPPPAPGPALNSSGDGRREGRFVTGAMLAGRYRIVGLLGKGGMGEVYKAEDLKLNQTVALKFLPESIALDGGMLARFHNEVRIARQVAHPNVCRVYDIGEVEGLSFLSMEFIDGEDLSSLLRRIGRLPGDKAVEIARQMCAGLAAAHEAGVLHRDLKPANVMIDGRGKARITDFGLAVVSEELRGDEVMAGTPAYMAPEQLTGKEATQRSDIYALGLTLYELFTGKRVFEAKSIQELISLHEKSTPPTPSSHVKDIDPLAERVILRCLEKDPKARPASAVQVALALPGGDPLQAALAMGETPSPEMVAASGEKTGLRPAVAVACLAAIIILLAVFAWVNEKNILISRVPMENSPEVLARRGRDFAAQFGYPEKPTDTAYGFTTDTDMLAYARAGERRGGRSLLSREQLATGRPAAYEYWYRESPLYLREVNDGGLPDPRVTLDNPPLNVSGMVAMRLDPLGRLRYFAAVPPQIELSEAAARPFDRAALFVAAGLDQSGFTVTESQWTPLASWDERVAWTGTWPGQPDVPIRLEAAAYRGQLIYFQIIEPWTKPMRESSVQRALRSGWAEASLNWLLLIAMLILGWKNYRQGKGDRRGAFRLAIFMAITFLLSTVLTSSHAPVVPESMFIFLAIAVAAFGGVAAWSAYMALEPFIRRRLPETLITWSRVLAGQLRDPLHGRDVLIGILAASGWSVLRTLFNLSITTNPALDSLNKDALLGTRHNAGILISAFTLGVAGSVALLMLFFLLRLVMRKQWLTAAGVILINALISSAANLSVINACIWFLWFGLMMFLLLRFGLVACCVLVSSAIVLVSFPITANFSVWYASNGLLAIVVLLALAGVAFYTSLGGQKVFKGSLLEE